jgi:hypothetical protein
VGYEALAGAVERPDLQSLLILKQAKFWDEPSSEGGHVPLFSAAVLKRGWALMAVVVEMDGGRSGGSVRMVVVVVASGGGGGGKCLGGVWVVSGGGGGTLSGSGVGYHQITSSIILFGNFLLRGDMLLGMNARLIGR